AVPILRVTQIAPPASNNNLEPRIGVRGRSVGLKASFAHPSLFLRIDQTTSERAGSVAMVAREALSASAMAFEIAGVATVVPASPIPLRPRGESAGVSVLSSIISGDSVTPGIV